MVLSMSTKAQSLSFDFLIACTIFLLIILILFTLSRYSITQIGETEKINQIIRTSDQLSEIWMREGTPENWNTSDAIDLGLVSDSRLNQTKLGYLEDFGYREVKRRLGVGIYDFYLGVYDLNNNTMFSFGQYPSNSEFISKNRRIGILNSAIVFIDTLVWE